MELITNKNFFFENYIIDVLLFIIAIISLLATTLTIYLLCEHFKLRMLMVSLILHQVEEVGTVTQKEINTECKTLTYINLTLTILGLVMITILHYRKSKLCRGHMFSNRYTMLCTYKIMHNHRKYPFGQNNGPLKPENIKLNQNYIRNTLEID